MSTINVRRLSGVVFVQMLIIALFDFCLAQQDTLADFNSIRTPSSPAFVLLGVEPASVERPNSPSDFAVTMLNRTQYLSAIPKDFALEASPYWWYEHAKLKWEDESRRNVCESIARTATVSLAVAEIGDQANPVTGLSFGLRFSPISGKLSDQTQEAIRGILDSLHKETDLIAAIVASKKREVRWQERQDSARNEAKAAQAGGNQDRRDSALAQLKALQAELTRMTISAHESQAYRETVDPLRAAGKNFILKREGLILEVAGGLSGAFPGGSAKQGRIKTWGVWLTAGEQRDDLSYLAVARYLGAAQDTLPNVIDLGGRFIYSNGRMALSGEGVCKIPTKSGNQNNQWRVAGIIDYKLNDDVWMTATFGQDFERASKGSLLTQIALSLNIHGERYSFP